MMASTNVKRPVGFRQPRIVLIVSAIITSVVLVSPSSAKHTRSVSSLAAATSVKTFAYHANGKLAGYVEREATRRWLASSGHNSEIVADSKGSYAISEGHTVVGNAWPKPTGQRSRYVVSGSKVRFVRLLVSATRWDIVNGSRRIGFTKGPDGVAAALGFTQWGDDMLPD
jgi:hypothetical protein